MRVAIGGALSHAITLGHVNSCSCYIWYDLGKFIHGRSCCEAGNVWSVDWFLDAKMVENQHSELVRGFWDLEGSMTWHL